VLGGGEEELTTKDTKDAKDRELLEENVAKFVEIALEFKEGKREYQAFEKGKGHKKIKPQLMIANFLKNVKYFDNLNKTFVSVVSFVVPMKDTSLIFRGFAALVLVKDFPAEWGLDRKVRERWEEAGMPHDEAAWLVDLAKTVITRFDAKKPPKTPAELLVQNYEAEDFRALLGVNTWDGTVWYNKERFEAALEYAPLFAGLAADGKKVSDWVKAIRTAGEKSGYKLDVLIQELEEKNAEKTKKSGKKVTE
jgi:hypothetical protein